jgi:NOL1/NOP2/fmu family ribosome biogenesis protein
MKESLRILPTKEIKFFKKLIKEQWDADFKDDFAFLINTKNKIYIANKDIGKVDLDKLTINTVGMYFGEYRKEQLRLSIEGSQLIGPLAKKNVVEIPDVFVVPWLKGIDIALKVKQEGFVIIKNKSDFMGCGKVMEDKILNFVPKARRLMIEDLP